MGYFYKYTLVLGCVDKINCKFSSTDAWSVFVEKLTVLSIYHTIQFGSGTSNIISSSHIWTSVCVPFYTEGRQRKSISHPYCPLELLWCSRSFFCHIWSRSVLGSPLIDNHRHGNMSESEIWHHSHSLLIVGQTLLLPWKPLWRVGGLNYFIHSARL